MNWVDKERGHKLKFLLFFSSPPTGLLGIAVLLLPELGGPAGPAAPFGALAGRAQHPAGSDPPAKPPVSKWHRLPPQGGPLLCWWWERKTGLAWGRQHNSNNTKLRNFPFPSDISLFMDGGGIPWAGQSVLYTFIRNHERIHQIHKKNLIFLNKAWVILKRSSINL